MNVCVFRQLETYEMLLLTFLLPFVQPTVLHVTNADRFLLHRGVVQSFDNYHINTIVANRGIQSFRPPAKSWGMGAWDIT